jgi:hypothetical protein
MNAAGGAPGRWSARLAEAEPAFPSGSGEERPGSKEEEQVARDEMYQGSQCAFHAVSNVLETPLTRFVSTKCFPSLSFSIHAKGLFLLMWHLI